MISAPDCLPHNNATPVVPSWPIPSIVLTDVDDTLTWEGRLPLPALDALYRLEAAGIDVILVTGACAGWCDQMARLWPVAAVIGENGAFVIEQQGRHLHYHDTQSSQLRAHHQQRLHQVASGIMARFPVLRLAQDQCYRRYDLALYHGQEVEGVPDATVEQALALFHEAGIQATASSIHINAWIGEFSKPEAALRWLAQRYGLSQEHAKTRCAYLGDSRNDAAMFRQFPNSIGVANIRPYLAQLDVPPARITQAPGGYGFAEWVNHLLPPQAG